MDRETTTLMLPKSQKEVEVITYFTRGERNQIQNITFEGMEVKGMHEVDGKQVPDFTMDFKATIKAKNKTLEIVIKSIDSKTASKEDVENLPEEDAVFIEKYIDSITPDEEEKKN